jgi:hypothetical protein
MWMRLAKQMRGTKQTATSRAFGARCSESPAHLTITALQYGELAEAATPTAHRPNHLSCGLRSNRPRRFSIYGLTIQTLWKMLEPSYTQEPYIGSIRWSGSIRCGLCFSQVMPFLCELLPRTAKYELNWPAFFLLGGELALPQFGWPASAA